MSFTHLHLLLNHFPVIGTIIGVALLGFALIRRNSDIGKLALGMFVVLAATSIAVYLTGEPAEDAIEKLPGFSKQITERHEEFALVATIALSVFGALALGVLFVFRKKELPRWTMLGTFALSICAAGLMGYTALLGGQVRHTEVRASSAAAPAIQLPESSE
jgi:uncharacterized membrane protein